MHLQGLSTLTAPMLKASLTSQFGRIFAIARSSDYAHRLSEAFRELDMRSPSERVDLLAAAELVEKELPLECGRYHTGVYHLKAENHWHLAMTRLPTMIPSMSEGGSSVLVNEVLNHSTTEALAQGAADSAYVMEGFAIGEDDFKSLECKLKAFEFKMNLDLAQGLDSNPQAQEALQEGLMPITFSPLEFILKRCGSPQADQIQTGIQALKDDLDQAMLKGER